MEELTNKELIEINGGSEHSYEVGKKVGEGIRDALIVIGIISLFI